MVQTYTQLRKENKERWRFELNSHAAQLERVLGLLLDLVWSCLQGGVKKVNIMATIVWLKLRSLRGRSYMAWPWLPPWFFLALPIADTSVAQIGEFWYVLFHRHGNPSAFSLHGQQHSTCSPFLWELCSLQRAEIGRKNITFHVLVWINPPSMFSADASHSFPFSCLVIAEVLQLFKSPCAFKSLKNSCALLVWERHVSILKTRAGCFLFLIGEGRH